MNSILSTWQPPQSFRLRAVLRAPSPATIPATLPSSPAAPHELRSTWTHHLYVAAGAATITAALAKSSSAALLTNDLTSPLAAAAAAYLLSDLGSGVFHWAVDNYGDASTPIFGSQIEAFQGHHRFPWTITRRQFSNNLHALGRAIAIALLPIDILVDNDTVLSFAGVFSFFIMFSQQFHAWAHGTRSKLPPIVVAMQDAGVLISMRQHGAHHRAPHNSSYCLVSGVWNQILDERKVWEAMELVIFFRFGVRPRSWSEPGDEWVEERES